MPDYSRLLASASSPYPVPLASVSCPVLVFQQVHPVKLNETITKISEKNETKTKRLVFCFSENETKRRKIFRNTEAMC